ncbi:GAF domain protein [Lysobacter antibioticus]|uniref:GAF domain protein n=1 Tax=Lysobacter antibioticus TaxID=84531 RepID=A0A0S2FI67_LYSAN|nr:GAF domain-containing protein [Lysobacter antibioticus]ALN61240.1 GAF domain protein [Lysobacter antibioticus]ALN83192.1 GAF domain protein [Lysobacter antibioticus]
MNVIAMKPETERQRALDQTRIVDSLPEPVYQDLVCLAAAICDTSIALISLVDRDRQWFKAKLGIDEREMPRSMAVCDHAIRKPAELFEVRDLASDPRFSEFPYVRDGRARFYAGVPLLTEQGAAIGTVCVLDQAPRTLDEQQRNALRSLSRVTSALIEAHRGKHVAEVKTLLQPQAKAPGPERAPQSLTIAVIRIQGYAELVARLGERATEKLLQALDQVLDQGLRHDLGDHIDRITGTPEYVAILRGDEVATRLNALRAALDRHQSSTSAAWAMGVAHAREPVEPMPAIYLRADEELSRQLDQAAGRMTAAA